MSNPSYNQEVIETFRKNDGKVPGWGENLMLLTTTGAKSGQPRTTPLVYSTDGNRIVIAASKGGAPTNPDWYHNLLAHPTATVELPGERFDVRATVADEAERDRLYKAHAELMPNFAEYETKTSRKIPIVVLERQA